MIQQLIDNTVGKNAKIVFALRKQTVKKYSDLDYEGLEFTDDLSKYFKDDQKSDLILLDGNNGYKTVRKLFNFAMKKLNKGGVVVLANSLPPNRARYVTPEERPGNWYGEVWRVVSGMNYINGVDFVTVGIGNGYTVIRKAKNPDVFPETSEVIDLQSYSDNRTKYARLVTTTGLGVWYANGGGSERTDTQEA